MACHRQPLRHAVPQCNDCKQQGDADAKPIADVGRAQHCNTTVEQHAEKVNEDAVPHVCPVDALYLEDSPSVA